MANPPERDTDQSSATIKTLAEARVDLVERAEDLARIAGEAACSPRVGVDVEADGMFVYRARLCTVQLSWMGPSGLRIAIVDTLAVSPRGLSALLGPTGPIKVLHDLAFDARILAEVGVPLGRVRDTSVSARFLGMVSTGLGSLLASELSVTVSKSLQQHDWGLRPLTSEHLAYLANDVRYLLSLEDHLTTRVAARDLEPEVEAECAHRLASAMGPPRDSRPGYVRLKGAMSLDPPGRAVLRRVFQFRETTAEALNVPPFKVAPNEWLVELARTKPQTPETLARVSSPEVWLEAIAEGLRDGDVPKADRELFLVEPPSRDERNRRRKREAQVTRMRRNEALARGVDEQAILPGHCAQELVDALLEFDVNNDGAQLAATIAAIPGLGARRLERYGSAMLALATEGTSEAGRTE